jgi:hypothetical protein
MIVHGDEALGEPGLIHFRQELFDRLKLLFRHCPDGGVAVVERSIEVEHHSTNHDY